MAQPTAADFEEFGVPADLPFSGFAAYKELIDVSEVSVHDIRKMYRRDGQVRSIYRLLALPIRTLSPVFTPKEGLDGSDGEEEAEFVTNAFSKPARQGGMTMSFGRVMTQMTKALVDGYAVFEKVWQVTPDNQLTYRKLANRDATTIKFLLDETGGLAGVRQRVQWQGKYRDITIPSDKLLIYTAQHEENPWYGESYLLPAFYEYDQKQKLRYISNIAFQFHAIPGRIGSLPDAGVDPNEKSKFRQALANFGFNTAMTKPAAWTVEEFGGKGTMPNFKEMLDYIDTQMAKSVLVQFLQLGTGSNTGSWSLSSDQSDLFTMALQAVADEMAETIAFYAIPQLVDFNFNSSAYPEVTLGPLADATKEMMAEVFKEIADAGSVNVTPEFMFELEAKVADELGLEINYEELREEQRLRDEQERALALLAQEALVARAQEPPQPDQDAPGEAEGGSASQTVAASEAISLMDVLAARRERRRWRR
jgi:hypothetical protein